MVPVWVWVITGFAGLFVFIILLLCFPLELKLAFDTAAKPRFRMNLTGFFGLLDRDVSSPPRKPRSRAGFWQRISSGRKMWSALTVKGQLSNIKKLVLGILRQVRLKEVSANLNIGFDDPADGGMIFAFTGMIGPVLRLPKKYELNIKPCFSEKSYIVGNLQCKLRLLPVRLIVPVCRFLFSVPTLKTLRILISNSWKGRKHKRSAAAKAVSF